MKMVFLAVGKKHDPQYAEAIAEFTNRVGRYVPVEWKIVPAAELAGSDISRAQNDESRAIEAQLKDGDILVVLDEKGKEYSSADFAAFIQKRLNEGPKRIVFLIGGAFGVSAEIAGRAHHVVSLSKLTFPHQLVRVILAEQAYRALSITKGEKYHHAS